MGATPVPTTAVDNPGNVLALVGTDNGGVPAPLVNGVLADPAQAASPDAEDKKAAPPSSFSEVAVPATASFTDSMGSGLEADPVLLKFIETLQATAEAKSLLQAKAHSQPTINNSGPHTASDIREDYRKLIAEKKLKGSAAQTLKRHWCIGMRNLFQFMEDGRKMTDPTYDWVYGCIVAGTVVPKDKRVSIKGKDYFQGGDYPVRAILVSLLDAVWKAVHSSPNLAFKCDNRHSGESPDSGRINQDQHNFFSSVDLYLPGQPQEATGFWDPAHATALLQQVKASANDVGASWSVYYNDPVVAAAVNETSLNVKFKGKSRHINWHGPGRGTSGLKLHMHLDAVPARGTKDDF